MAQLAFQWPTQPSHAAEDFIVSDANAEAVRFLENWPDEHSHVALISGPEACGKTHLASIWAKRTHAAIIDTYALGRKDSENLWKDATHAVLEDVHTITHQTALFHFLRHAETQKLSLLLTARAPAAQLHFALADLRSRLLALPSAHIQTPDEELLRGFLLKGFADRQLRVSDEVVGYLLKRMERSFVSAHALVELLERQALQNGRDITVPFIKNALG